MKTVLPVKILVDLLTVRGEGYDGLLPMTITIEDDELTIGSYEGPDVWRGKLSDLKEKDNEGDKKTTAT